MAYEKLSNQLTLANNLDSYITSQLNLVTKQRARAQLEAESKFTRAVLEDNLTLEQQLEYRKDQLNQTTNRDERRDLRDKIATLKNQIEQKAFTDSYVDELMRLNEGTQSVESTVSWLQNKLAKTTDQDLISKIKENINTLKGKQYEIQQTTIQKGTEFANNSKATDIINTQINKVNGARSKALLAGNNDYVAVLDLQLQSLNKTLNESTLTNNMLQLANSALLGQSALATLNAYNKYLETSDTKTPITVGGQRFNSAKEFWEGKRSEFLNDRSGNGFFPRYQNELKNQIDYKVSKGILNNDSMSDVKAWYDTTKNRPELADYQERITQDQQTALKLTADNRANSILNEYATKNDSKKAINDLAYIQDTYGVDMTTNYQKVIANASKDREDQVRNLISTMGEVMKANPGMSQADALKEAAKVGAAATFSPEEMATKSAEQIITETPKKSAEQFANPQKMTPDLTKEGKTFAEKAPLVEGQLYRAKNDNAVYKYEGGKLRTFVGNWSPDQFKQATGKTFEQVNVIDNVTGYKTGDMITPDTAKVEAPMPQANQAVGEKISSPGLMKYYTPDQIVKRGTDIFLKPEVKSVVGKLLTPEEFANMQKDKNLKPADLEKKIIRDETTKNIYLRQ